MAALEISGNGESSNHITEEIVMRTIDSLENPLQKVRFFKVISYKYFNWLNSVDKFKM